jgi:hypothetical protein
MQWQLDYDIKFQNWEAESFPASARALAYENAQYAFNLFKAESEAQNFWYVNLASTPSFKPFICFQFLYEVQLH